jgi:hypothetical protein
LGGEEEYFQDSQGNSYLSTPARFSVFNLQTNTYEKFNNGIPLGITPKGKAAHLGSKLRAEFEEVLTKNHKLQNEVNTLKKENHDLTEVTKANAITITKQEKQIESLQDTTNQDHKLMLEKGKNRQLELDLMLANDNIRNLQAKLDAMLLSKAPVKNKLIKELMEDHFKHYSRNKLIKKCTEYKQLVIELQASKQPTEVHKDTNNLSSAFEDFIPLYIIAIPFVAWSFSLIIHCGIYWYPEVMVAALRIRWREL